MQSDLLCEAAVQKRQFLPNSSVPEFLDFIHLETCSVTFAFVSVGLDVQLACVCCFLGDNAISAYSGLPLCGYHCRLVHFYKAIWAGSEVQELLVGKHKSFDPQPFEPCWCLSCCPMPTPAAYFGARLVQDCSEPFAFHVPM